jgi:hypothetical protein
MKTAQHKASTHNKNQKTKPRAGEYQTEKNLRQFCELTSQELSSRLGAIVGELDYALATPSPAVRERSMGIALSAAQEAMALSRNLKYFAVQTRLDFSTTDLSQIVLDTVEMVEQDFELKKIKFTVFAEAGTFAAVDANGIQQAFLNILVDAADRMPNGGNITLLLKQHSKKIEVQYTVNPTRPAPNTQEGDQQPVPKHPNDRDTDEEKSPLRNLSMTVARALVEAHGGEITVQNTTTGHSVLIELPFPAKNSRPSPFPYERRFRRIQVRMPVDITFINGQNTLRTEISVISVGGCYIRIPEAKLMRLPELNETVAIRLYYYGNESVDIPRGRIASVAWAGSQSGIGIDFMEVGSRANRLLHAIVKTHSF